MIRNGVEQIAYLLPSVLAGEDVAGLLRNSCVHLVRTALPDIDVESMPDEHGEHPRI
jgi:hypothetical protein